MKNFYSACSKILNETVGLKFELVTAPYILFTDTKELFFNTPGNFELKPDVDFTSLDVQGWKKVKLAVGEDIAEYIPGRNDGIRQEDKGKFFEISGIFPSEKIHTALISF
jgi:hypothetical protein